VGNLLDTVQSSDVVQSVDAGRETTMKTENLVIDQGSEGEVVKEVGEILPDISVSVFAKTFVVETVDLGDLTGLVVSSEDGDSLRVSDLEGDEKSDGLNRVVTSVNIITHEKVVGIGVGSTNLEELHQVVELAVDITTDGDGAFHWLHVRLLL
jgi:hypothetical protein